MSKHHGVVTAAPRTPLELIELPTCEPEADEALVRIDWCSTGPADLHQADFKALDYPFVLGDSIAGEVLRIGPGVTTLQPGNAVFGFVWRSNRQRGMQEYATIPVYQLGKIPSNISKQEASVVPVNFVTVFNAFARNVPDGRLPWPKPEGWKPHLPNRPLLVWGGSGSCGQYAIQISRFYGYTNIWTTASKQHHAMLQSYGAVRCFDYRSPDAEDQLRDAFKEHDDPPLVFDAIGSADASLSVIARVVPPHSIVVLLLPIVVKAETETEAPVFTWDPKDVADWPEGVHLGPVRTYFYLEDEELKETVQSGAMPGLLASGAVKPNKYREVEAPTLLERVTKALEMLRRKEVSAERLTLWVYSS